MANRACIAIFSAQFLPHLGGVENFTDGLSRTLEQTGAHAVVVTTVSSGLSVHEVRKDGVEIFRLPAKQLLDGRLPVTLRNGTTDSLLDEIAALGINGVLVNTRLYEHSLIGCEFARKIGLRPVVLDHGSSYIGFGIPGVDEAVHAYERRMTERLKVTDPAFYGISRRSADWLSTFGIEAQGVIHNAIDVNGFRKSASKRDFRKEFNIDDNALLVSYIGRIVSGKGADTAIETARILEHRHANVEFLIAGDGPDARRLAALAPSNVHMLGRLDRTDVAALLAGSNLNFFPSQYPEGLPTVLLEAAAVGTPSLVTDVGGAREVIPDDTYGIVLEEADPEVCAEVIAWYEGNTDILTYQGKLSQQRVEREFSWTRTTKAVIDACSATQESSLSHGPYPGDSLERLHEVELDILLEIDRVCRENGITYFLDGGTCLGAVRHGGFIPWDDDVDVAMPHDDYVRFLAIAPKVLGECFSIHTPQNTPTQAALWAKVYRDGTRFLDSDNVEAGNDQGIFVDVFDYRRLALDPREASRQVRAAVLWQRISYLYHTGHPRMPRNDRFRSVLQLACLVAHEGIFRVFTPKEIALAFGKAWNSGEQSNFWVNSTYANNKPLNGEVLYPPKPISFAGHLLPAPNDTDTYLTAIYGDWRKLPPVSKRYTHTPEVLDFGDGINVMDYESVDPPSLTKTYEVGEPIDILLATYNGAEYLAQQLDSILSQTYKNWNLIVSDDGSTDDTVAIVDSYIARDSRIRWATTTQQHVGSAKNFMQLLSQSTAPYVMFCDQDDVWNRDKVELTLAKMHELERRYSTVDPLMVFTDLEVVNSRLERIAPSFMKMSFIDPTRTSLEELLYWPVAPGCTMMINANLRSFGAKDDSFTSIMKHDWWLSLIAAGLGHIGYLPLATSKYRQHGSNVVGAQQTSLALTLSTSVDAAQNSIRKAMRRVRLFMNTFGDQLALKDHEALTAFLAIPDAGPLERLPLMMKAGIWKRGRLRAAGQALLTMNCNFDKEIVE